MQIFTVKKEHLKLLKGLYFQSFERVGGFNAIQVDEYRPFGNGDTISEMAKILNVSVPCEYCSPELYKDKVLAFIHLYNELEICLQILTKNLKIEEGTYEADDYDVNWRLVRKTLK